MYIKSLLPKNYLSIFCQIYAFPTLHSWCFYHLARSKVRRDAFCAYLIHFYVHCCTFLFNVRLVFCCFMFTLQSRKKVEIFYHPFFSTKLLNHELSYTMSLNALSKRKIWGVQYPCCTHALVKRMFAHVLNTILIVGDEYIGFYVAIKREFMRILSLFQRETMRDFSVHLEKRVSLMEIANRRKY